MDNTLSTTLWLARYDALASHAQRAGCPADLLSKEIREDLEDHITLIRDVTRATEQLDQLDQTPDQRRETEEVLERSLRRNRAKADAILDDAWERIYRYIRSMRELWPEIGRRVCAEIPGCRFWTPRGDGDRCAPARIYFGADRWDWVALDPVFVRGGQPSDWRRFELVAQAIERHAQRIAHERMGL